MTYEKVCILPIAFLIKWIQVCKTTKKREERNNVEWVFFKLNRNSVYLLHLNYFISAKIIIIDSIEYPERKILEITISLESIKLIHSHSSKIVFVCEISEWVKAINIKFCLANSFQSKHTKVVTICKRWRINVIALCVNTSTFHLMSSQHTIFHIYFFLANSIGISGIVHHHNHSLNILSLRPKI